jgi:hypothetical protein
MLLPDRGGLLPVNGDTRSQISHSKVVGSIAFIMVTELDFQAAEPMLMDCPQFRQEEDMDKMELGSTHRGRLSPALDGVKVLEV